MNSHESVWETAFIVSGKNDSPSKDTSSVTLKCKQRLKLFEGQCNVIKRAFMEFLSALIKNIRLFFFNELIKLSPDWSGSCGLHVRTRISIQAVK